jgi:hypothetical protein
MHPKSGHMPGKEARDYIIRDGMGFRFNEG